MGGGKAKSHMAKDRKQGAELFALVMQRRKAKAKAKADGAKAKVDAGEAAAAGGKGKGKAKRERDGTGVTALQFEQGARCRIPDQKRPRLLITFASGEATSAADAADDALEAKTKKQVVVTMKQGVKFIDVKVGDGPTKPVVGRFVLIDYTAHLGQGTDGEVFDTSQGDRKPVGRDQKGAGNGGQIKKVKYPARQKVTANRDRKKPPWGFRYGTGKVIRGLELGMKSMREGGERVIMIPSKLAYGEGGTKKVKPNTDITFVVELVSVGSAHV